MKMVFVSSAQAYVSDLIYKIKPASVWSGDPLAVLKCQAVVWCKLHAKADLEFQTQNKVNHKNPKSYSSVCIWSSV